ncbi:MAG: 16S rRNA (adenine(1518)-N(6)/adenine(1519)-N(6))-dimethyltransferase RsmA [Pseudomonadota bacterium]
MDKRPDLTQAPARKALGQHFLFDPDILRRTALAAGPVQGRTVFEVGPGPGGLTRALLDEGVARLVVVEADERFASALREWPEAREGRLEIVEGDARKVDFTSLADRSANDDRPAMIIANLPYNVGTPLLINWLKAGAWRGEMVLMFQKEVAERVCARPGSPHYGRLAVLSQAVCETHIAFALPPGAFKPPPKVDSAVAVLRPLSKQDRFDALSALETVTAAAFGQRRKMLRAGLKGLAKKVSFDAASWVEEAGLDPTDRPETVDQAGFRRLAEIFVEASGR